MNSVDEVSNKIGITLLNTKGEKTGKDVVTYNPSVSEKEKLKGVLVQNHCYYYGDITNVITNKEYGTKEYVYYGGVSHDTMKEFFDTLK